MSKIPEFPYFKKLELSDKKELEKLTCEFLPYSDFNFANMWSWDIHQKMMICQLNKNLVVLFNDYVSGEHFLTFIGSNNITETTSDLIAFSKRNYHTSFLKLVPKEVALALSDEEFNSTPDRDSFDYIYSVEHLSGMDKWEKSSQKRKIRDFINRYPDYTVKITSIHEILHDEHKALFKSWAINKKIENHSELNEYKAFERILQIRDSNIKVLSLYVNDTLIGFTIYEIISHDYAVAHFSKADLTYPSSYELLIWEEAKALNAKKIKYYNWELDLGIEGLRYFKEKYRPAFFLKKFIVCK